MTFRPSPKQALFLWKMIAAETAEEREPDQSMAKPDLHPTKEREPLFDNGFLELEKRGRAQHLLLTERAWVWAAGCADVELMKSNSRDGAIALQGLLRRLLPLLRERGIPLAELFSMSSGRASAGRSEAVTASQPERATALRPTPEAVSRRTAAVSHPTSAAVSRRTAAAVSHPTSAAVSHPTPMLPPSASGTLAMRIREACLELAESKPGQAVRLAELRASLADISRPSLDAELLVLKEQGHVALYQNDNVAEVAPDDDGAALFVGDAPRHLLYWKG